MEQKQNGKKIATILISTIVVASILVIVAITAFYKFYDPEKYGIDTIEIHTDAIEENDIVLLHDDLLATGGSMKAAYDLVQAFNPQKTYINFIIELKIEGLKGRTMFEKDTDITTLLTIDE